MNAKYCCSCCYHLFSPCSSRFLDIVILREICYMYKIVVSSFHWGCLIKFPAFDRKMDMADCELFNIFCFVLVLLHSFLDKQLVVRYRWIFETFFHAFYWEIRDTFGFSVFHLSRIIELLTNQKQIEWENLLRTLELRELNLN